MAELAALNLLGQIPIVQSIREGGDEGKPAATETNTLTGQAFADMPKMWRTRYISATFSGRQPKKLKLQESKKA